MLPGTVADGAEVICALGGCRCATKPGRGAVRGGRPGRAGAGAHRGRPRRARGRRGRQLLRPRRHASGCGSPPASSWPPARPAAGVPEVGARVLVRVDGDVVAFPAEEVRRDHPQPGRRPTADPLLGGRPGRRRPADGGRHGHVRRAGRAVDAEAARLGSTRRLRAARDGQRRRHAWWPARRARRTAPRGCCSGAPSDAEPSPTADVVQASAPTYAPAPADLHPDLALLLSDLGLDRVAQAGAALARQPAGQRAQHRRVPRPRRRRPRDHLAAAALLLRALGAHQPPHRRGRRRAHRPVGGRRVLLGPWRTQPARPASPGCRTPSTCSTPAASPTATCPTCATSPRPAAGWRPTQVVRYAELGRAPRLGPRRHVRADRGHRPDGLPAAVPRRHPSARPSASRSPAATCGSRRSTTWPTASASWSTPGRT